MPPSAGRHRRAKPSSSTQHRVKEADLQQPLLHVQDTRITLNAEAATQGQHATQKLLAVEETPAPTEIAARLKLPPGVPVIVRRRLFVVDDEPMQLCDGYYPTDLFQGTAVAEPGRIKGGVHALIEDPEGPVRARVTRFIEDLDVRLPVPAESNAFRS